MGIKYHVLKATCATKGYSATGSCSEMYIWSGKISRSEKDDTISYKTRAAADQSNG